MERKIGEIFEYNGEWYQCLESSGCKGCAFQGTICEKIKSVRGECVAYKREDRRPVIFKKLEKVGEPMKIHNRLVLKVKADAYKCIRCCFYSKDKCELTIQECKCYDCGEGTKFIEIKQNKEDMGEKKQKLDDLVGLYSSAQITYKEFDKELKALYTKQWEEDKPVLKPFNLEEAKEGKPVCTRDGRKARIICWDIEYIDNPIAAAVFMGECETVYLYTDKGEYNKGEEDELDLMMLPEKKEGWVNVYKDSIYKTKEDAFNRRAKWSYL